MEEFNSTFKRARSTEVKTDAAGKIVRDKIGNLIEVILRHEDPTGEYSLLNGVSAPQPRGQVFRHAIRAADL
jgi:hypothetical protein